MGLRETVTAAVWAIAFGASSAGAADSPYDLIVRGALIADGSGGAPYTGDILVRGDEIAAVGKAPAGARAGRVVEASGRVVAPGFIDAHAHGQALERAQMFENFLAMGVTTIVVGQDGSSPDGASVAGAPPTLAEWFASLEASPPSLNIAALVGFGSLRTEVGAPPDGAASPPQIDAMSPLVDRAMRAGAYGVSLGMEYVPMLRAAPEELRAIARAVARHDGLIMSHMRSEDDDRIAASVDELLDLGAIARVHVSHLKIVYGKSPAQADAVLQQLARARTRGVKVTADVYPYLASHAGIAIVFPEWAKVRADFDRALKLRRPELEAFLRERITRRGGPEATLLTTAPYTGLTLADVAREKRVSFVDVLTEIGPQGASGAYFVMSDAVQDRFIFSPDVMFSTDGSPSMFHPRGYGAYARIIETYVMKRGLPLAAAIRKMSALPAAALGLRDRGALRSGAKADLVVFDPSRVRETATYEDPRRLAEGFDIVVVNGKIVRENGALATARAGRALRRPG